ncbi:type III secretion system effector protein, partial [Xanthomonas perforans]
VQSLSPEQAQEYAQTVADSALQGIAAAGAQPRPARSVTITEITEANEEEALAAASASPEQRSPARTHPSPDQAAASTAPSS